MFFTLRNILVGATTALYILGRLCDDLGWYSWDTISTSGLEAIALGTLSLSAILTIARKSSEEGGIKILLFESQSRFIIPWSLVILIVILVFNIFGCQNTTTTAAAQAGLAGGYVNAEAAASTPSSFDMDYTGCCLYAVVILLTNLNYSVLCNVKGDLALLIFYELILFGEIIYNGLLIIRFINELTHHPKDYSILFISILIAWQMLVMDLIFRAVYEDGERLERVRDIQAMVVEHNLVCGLYKKYDIQESGRVIDAINEEIVDEKDKTKNEEQNGKKLKVQNTPQETAT